MPAGTAMPYGWIREYMAVLSDRKQAYAYDMQAVRPLSLAWTLRLVQVYHNRISFRK